jgi:DNA ligase (NAD+)
MSQVKDLIEFLNYHTDRYNEGKPEISDEEWDKAYFKLQELERTTGEVYADSPTHSIRYEVKTELAKVKHNHPMLSLAKTKNTADLEKFCHNLKSYPVFMSKCDGVSCSLRYKDGKLISAETRGKDGLIGEDVTHNAKVISNIPNFIPCPDDLTIDGEIVCLFNDFESVAENGEYANPRNYAAGSIRLLDASITATRKLSFVAWDVIKGMTNSLHINLFNLSLLGFTTTPYYYREPNTIDIDEAIAKIKEKSKVMGLPIDGIVCKYDDREYGLSLGSTAHHPLNAIAYKFYDEEYETTLRNIEWGISRNGILTPVACFDAINIDGTEVKRASLCNLSVMKNLSPQWYSGYKVNVIKSNQIIPKIVSVEAVNGDRLQLTPPSTCPICGKPTKIEVSDSGVEILKCENPCCNGKLNNRIDFYAGKKGLDIKGLSKATIDKLINLGWVTRIADIYTLKEHKKDWVKISGFGILSVEAILVAIESSKSVSLDKFIRSMGIPQLGTAATKELVKYIDSYEDFREKIKSNYHFYDIYSFGTVLHNNIVNFDYSEFDYIYENYLKNTIINPSHDTVTATNLDGLTFVITGKLHKFTNRQELVDLITVKGGKVTSSVSKKTDYLINNDKESATAKNIKAKELSIPIISEENFLNIFDL